MNKAQFLSETSDGLSSWFTDITKLTQCRMIDFIYLGAVSSTPPATAKPRASIDSVVFIFYDTAWPFWDLQAGCVAEDISEV